MSDRKGELQIETCRKCSHTQRKAKARTPPPCNCEKEFPFPPSQRRNVISSAPDMERRLCLLSPAINHRIRRRSERSACGRTTYRAALTKQICNRPQRGLSKTHTHTLTRAQACYNKLFAETPGFCLQSPHNRGNGSDQVPAVGKPRGPIG